MHGADRSLNQIQNSAAVRGSDAVAGEQSTLTFDVTFTLHLRPNI